MKLEFCLHEARSQTRKLQRVKWILALLDLYMRNQMIYYCVIDEWKMQMGEKRDKAIKELRDQVTGKQLNESGSGEKQNFWDTSGFKIVVSMSMLILVVVSKR